MINFDWVYFCAMILITLFFVLVFFIVYNFVDCCLKLWKSKLSSAPFLPLIGHSYLFVDRTNEGLFEKLMKLMKKFKSMGVFFGPIFVPAFYDWENISHITKCEHKIERGTLMLENCSKQLAQQFFFNLFGPTYKENKRVMMKAISFANIKGYMQSFNQNASRLSEKLVLTAREETDINPELNLCVLSVLLETIMGLEATSMSKEEIILFSEELSKVLQGIMCRMSRFWLYPDFLYKFSSLYRETQKSVDHVRRVIEKLTMARKNKSNGLQSEETTPNSMKRTFIDEYFTSKKNNGDDFTMEEIIDGVVSLLGAGLETTVASIGFATMMLAMNQDVQQQVYEEIISGIHNEDEDLNIKDISELTLLDRVVHETWRLYSPVPYRGRHLTDDIELPNGGLLKKGTDIIFVTFLLHRDPDVYPCPEKFNPDNFLPEKLKERPPAAFMPFGFGARKCFGNIFAGLLIKTVLYYMVKNAKFHTTKTEKDFQLAPDITLKNKFGFPVSLTPRQ